MLDLGVAEETDGGLVRLAPELRLGEVERIVEADDGIELLGEDLEVGLRLAHGGGGPAGGLGGGGESGRGGDGGCEDGKLHHGLGFVFFKSCVL